MNKQHAHNETTQLFMALTVTTIWIAALLAVLEANQLVTKLSILAVLPMVSLLLLRRSGRTLNAR